MKRQLGFTLIELMIVVAIIAIVAAIAIPSLLNARKSTNEAVAISSVRSLSTTNEQYRTRFRVYSNSLTSLNLSGYIDDSLGSGTKSGYQFSYSAGTSTWSCSALPITPGSTGDRYFFIDQSGVIRFSSSGPADSSSPPIEG